MLVLCLVWSFVSVVLGLLIGRCISLGQGRDAQRQVAWSPDSALAGLLTPSPAGGHADAHDVPVPGVPAPRPPAVPVAEHV